MAPQVRIGASGFSYKEWLGAFYPPKLPSSKWLEYYAAMIERSAPFPPPPPGYDQPVDAEPMPARFPDPREPTGIPDVVLTGHDPTSRGAEFRPKAR